MGATGKLVQHPLTISRVLWFAKDLSINFDNRVCAQNPSTWLFPRDIQDFLAGHAQSVFLWQLSKLNGFGSVTGDDNESDTDPLQQLPTARRGRGENELRSGTALFHAWDLIPLRCSTMSTLKLCRRAAGATGGFVRQCEAVGTDRLAARGTQGRVQRTLLRWTRYYSLSRSP